MTEETGRPDLVAKYLGDAPTRGKLVFIIPTWNRPQHLERCVESIASQVKTDDVHIAIQDNASQPQTSVAVDALREKYQFVSYRRLDTHVDYSESFRRAFAIGRDYEWAWTFGDDDLLKPKALEFVLDRLEHIKTTAENKPDFIHFAEQKRASGTNNVYFSARMLDLCNTFGLIEATGFITGNLTRGHLLADAVESPHWKSYSKCAFAHSCALLEVLKDRPAALYDVPTITSQEMSQNEDTGQRWAQENIALRYLFIVDALEVMYEYGILTEKLETRFFRYLNANLWDRYLTFFLNDYLDGKTLWAEEAWSRVGRFAQFMKDDEAAKELIQNVEAARGMTTLACYMQKNLDILHGQLDDIRKASAASKYPYTFCEARP